jgi:hypothetical protein
MARSLALWGPFDAPEIRAAGREAGRRGLEVAGLGIYTQGYWLRLREGSISTDVGKLYADLELELMDAVELYLKMHPEARAIHFPHPLERRHFAATGEVGPWSLLRHSRVESRYDDNTNSVGAFAHARVGVTTFSTVAYDRLYAGYPAYFYVGQVVYDSLEQDKSVRSLILRGPSDLAEAVDHVLSTGADQFFIDHFGGPLDEWRPDAETEALMRDYGSATGRD